MDEPADLWRLVHRHALSALRPRRPHHDSPPSLRKRPLLSRWAGAFSRKLSSPPDATECPAGLSCRSTCWKTTYVKLSYHGRGSFVPHSWFFRTTLVVFQQVPSQAAQAPRPSDLSADFAVRRTDAKTAIGGGVVPWPMAVTDAGAGVCEARCGGRCPGPVTRAKDGRRGEDYSRSTTVMPAPPNWTCSSRNEMPGTVLRY